MPPAVPQCHIMGCNPIPSAFPVWRVPEAVWWNQGCGCALSDNKKHTRLSWTGRIILENWRHLIAALQNSKNYKQQSLAINHFALIQQTPPHLNKSLEKQHCTKFWSDRVDISRGFVADGHTLGFCCTPNPSPALQPFALPWAASPAWLGQNSNKSTVFKGPLFSFIIDFLIDFIIAS